MEYLSANHKTCENEPVGTIKVERMYKNSYTDEIYFEVVQYTAENEYGVIAECQEEWLADAIAKTMIMVIDGEDVCPVCGKNIVPSNEEIERQQLITVDDVAIAINEFLEEIEDE